MASITTPTCLASDAQRFQIALAITVLKHKPRNQSVAEYLIELRKCFPLRGGSEDEASWKTRASELSGIIEGLKRKADEDAAELEVLRSQVSRVNTTKTGKPPIKKRKESTEESMPEGQEKVPQTANFATNTCVLPSYMRLKELMDQASESGSPLKVSTSILNSATHLLRSCSLQLVSSANTSSTHLRTLTNIRQLAEILASTFDGISSFLRSISGRKKQPKAAIDSCFQTMSQELVVPLVQRIRRITHDAYTHLLSPPLSGTKDSGYSHASICMELIGVLQHLLVTFSSSSTMTNNLQSHQLPFLQLIDILRHAALSEIQKLFGQGRSTDHEASISFGGESELTENRTIQRRGRASRAQRIQRLVRKDILSSLCSILRMTVTPGILFFEDEVPQASGQSLENLSRCKMEEALTGLLSRCARHGWLSDESRRKMRLDEVERGLLMGVVESFWLSSAA